jgi:hypothetical protein
MFENKDGKSEERSKKRGHDRGCVGQEAAGTHKHKLSRQGMPHPAA